MVEFDRLGDEASELGETISELTSMTAAFRVQMADLRGTIDHTTKDLGRLEGGFSRGLKKAIDGMVIDGDRLSDAFKGIAASMSHTVYNAALKPVTDHLGGMLSGLVNGAVSGVMPFKDGGSFSQGRVMPFAKGGIVSSPMSFPMRGGTGLMGEAGPEAIMPLQRTADGRLGVAGGGSSNVNVTMNITTPDVQGFQRSQAQIAAQMSRALGQGNRNR